MDFNAENVVITGGFGGIGLSLCKCFLKKKINNLIILDLQGHENDLQKFKKENPDGDVNIFYFPLDVCNKSNIEEVFKQITATCKFIDILVNAIGILDDSKPELTINVNLIGLINVTLTAFNCMGKNVGGRGGTIVNISSVAGLEPFETFPIYAASKYAVIGFTRSLACPLYYEETGIKLITICPGFTDTNIVKNLKDKRIFPFSRNLDMNAIPRQTSEQCAEKIIEALQVDKNGSIWLINCGELQEITPAKYWNK